MVYVVEKCLPIKYGEIVTWSTNKDMSILKAYYKDCTVKIPR